LSATGRLFKGFNGAQHSLVKKMVKKRKQKKFAMVIFLFAIAMIASNNIIQFFENLTKSIRWFR
jgi:accessory gene regulator protein AgrB